MKIYLSGPMRGRLEFNFPAFKIARSALRRKGHVVFCPAEHDEQNGFNPDGLTGHENLVDLGFNLPKALLDDLTWILTEADGVAVLPGWEHSKGANAEVAVARAIGLPVFTVESVL